MNKVPKVAIIYDRVNKFGGAERLLQVLHDAFPQAPLFTSVYEASKTGWTKGWDVRPSFLQSLPYKKHEHLAALMPLAFESLDLSEFDVVISVTSEAAKGVLTQPHTKHICWLLTPTRYLWSHEQEYEKQLGGIGKVLRFPLQKLKTYLKRWDLQAAQRPDLILPISKVVQHRCEQYYHRKTGQVLYPPIDTKLFSPVPKQPYPFHNQPYFLVVSRLVPYKRIDIAIQACIALKHHLVIIGTGSEEITLRKIAQSSEYIHFEGHLTDQEVVGYYQHCVALLFPGEEDFGLTAGEAIACGRPAVVYAKSGNAEIVQHSVTGIHVQDQTLEAWKIGMKQVLSNQWNTDTLRKSVLEYSVEKCVKKWRMMI